MRQAPTIMLKPGRRARNGKARHGILMKFVARRRRGRPLAGLNLSLCANKHDAVPEDVVQPSG